MNKFIYLVCSIYILISFFSCKEKNVSEADGNILHWLESKGAEYEPEYEDKNSMYDKNYWAAVAVKSGVDANGTKFKKNYDEFWDPIRNENMYYPVFL